MTRPRLLLIDNYDSFTYNLVHYLQDVGASVEVVRNDADSAEALIARGHDAIILSPGPCTPADAGVCVDLIRTAPASLPVFGVCLGHQAIGAAYGLKVGGAKEIVHGKVWAIRHGGDALFAGLPSPFEATRYHSLAVEVPDGGPLEVLAWTDDGEVMALKTKDRPNWGVQFHPESIGTPGGKTILGNVLTLAVTTKGVAR